MESSYRPLYGFTLSLVTAVLWGVLPLFLKICLEVMDSQTITLYRFVVAGVLISCWLFYRRRLPHFFRYPQAVKLLAVACTVMLVINYVFNVMSLRYLSPGSVQVFMQVAPFALMVGGILLYKERFSRLQLVGALSLLLGLSLFFNQRLPQIIASESEDTLGVLFVIIAAVSWAGYALCQKTLMKNLSAMQLTLIIYIIGSLILLPFTQLQTITTLNNVQGAALLFCCLNTFVGYGAFTEAMRVWYASRVSAVIATAPIFTFISVAVAEYFYPSNFEQPPLGFMAVLGAVMVIGGSILAALGRGSR